MNDLAFTLLSIHLILDTFSLLPVLRKVTLMAIRAFCTSLTAGATNESSNIHKLYCMFHYWNSFIFTFNSHLYRHPKTQWLLTLNLICTQLGVLSKSFRLLSFIWIHWHTYLLHCAFAPWYHFGNTYLSVAESIFLPAHFELLSSYLTTM